MPVLVLLLVLLLIMAVTLPRLPTDGVAVATHSGSEVRVSPTAVAAGRVELSVVGADAGDRILLTGIDGFDDPPIELLVPKNPKISAMVVSSLRAGRYNVSLRGVSTGQVLTAAQPYPPRPITIEPGTAVTLRSENFPTSLLRVSPDGVTIERESRQPGSISAESIDAAALRVRSLPSRCSHGPASASSSMVLLESCAHPGLLLAHGLGDKTMLRLALPPADAAHDVADSELSCEAARWEHVLWHPLTPGLGGAETVSLLTRPVGVTGTTERRPTARDGATSARYGAIHVARHANSKLQISHSDGLVSSGIVAGAVDPLLAADASWRLLAPSDLACSRLAPLADESMGYGGAARAALLRTTARARLAITIGGAPASGGGALTVALYGGVVPKTVDNFVRLCRGDLEYKFEGSAVQRVIRGFMAQGGSTDGGYGKSSWGGQFEDESFVLTHDGRGVLSMANAGDDTNGSQFFMLFRAQAHLDGKHVVFGKVVEGMAVLDAIEAVGSRDGKTSAEVRIAGCELVE